MGIIRLLFLAMVLAACAAPGASSDAPDPTATASASAEPTTSAEAFATGTLEFVPGIADGPGAEIPEAIAVAPTELQLANGWLLIDAAGDVWLCESLAESMPPSCAGDRLHVVGYPNELDANVQEANGVRWYPQKIQVLGNVTVP